MNRLPLLTIAKGLLWLAAVISAYLATVTLLSESIPGCSSGTACESILRGSWSHVLGIPVSFFGVAIYVLGTALAEAYATGSARERWPVFFAQCCYGTIVLAAIWFVALQALVIKSFCVWCCSAHVAATVAIGLLVFLRRQHHVNGDSLQDSSQAVSVLSHRVMRPACLGGCLAVVTAALTHGPLTFQPKSVVAKAAGGGLVSGGREVPLLTMQNGRFNFETKKLGYYGDPSSSNIAVALVDFTCDFCRKYQPVLSEAAKNGVIYLLPTYHTEMGAEIQRMMLVARWIDAKKCDDVAAAMYVGNLTPEPTAVRQALVKAFGEAAFTAAIAKDWKAADLIVQQAKGVLEGNRFIANSDRLPQLIKEDRVLVGYYESAKQVQEFMGAAQQTMPSATANSVLAAAGNTAPAVISPGAGTITASGDVLPPVLLSNRYLDLGVQTSGSELPVQILLRNPRTSAFRIGWFSLDQGLTLQPGLNMEVPAQVAGGVPLTLRVPNEPGDFARNVKVMSPDGAEVLTVTVRGTAAAATAAK